MRLTRTIWPILIFSCISGCFKAQEKSEDNSHAFMFTIETTFDNATVRIPVYSPDPNDVFADVDCDGDGRFEQTGLNGNIKCTFEKAGTHQISMHGKIPSLMLGEIYTYCTDDQCMDSCVASCKTDCEAVINPYRVLSPKADIFHICDIQLWYKDKDNYCKSSCKEQAMARFSAYLIY